MKTTDQEKNCTQKEENNTPSISNSELSFLDDINVDEIVESLLQPKSEPDARQEEPGHGSKSPEESIIIIDDDSDTQNSIIFKQNSEDNNNEALVKLENHNDFKQETSISAENINKTHIKNNDMDLSEQRAPISIIDNSSILEVENMESEGVKEENKNVSIEILEEDDMIETLSTCSTVILGSQLDIDECSDIPEKPNKSLDLETTKIKICSTSTKKICEHIESKTQFREISELKSTEENEIIRDPIEAQLHKIFEMYSSDSFDLEVNKNPTENLDKNTFKGEPEAVASSLQNEKQIPVEQKPCEAPNTKNQDQRSIVKEAININTSVKKSPKVLKSQEPYIDREVGKSIKSVKSEIRIVTRKKLPLKPEENFIEALEARMLIFLKTPYTVTSILHEGKHSKIYQCIDRGGFNYALKILNNTRDRYHMGIEKENMLISVQKDIPKENLHCVYLINGFSMCGYWCFLMEYYPKNVCETLRENNKSFHIDTVQVLSKQLIAAVTVLRNNNIVHSDIKPSHILINSKNNRIKLCGFDTAYNIKEAVIVPNIGTVNYRPPEVILGYSSGFSLDVWSSALVMYELATNTKLFPGCYNNDILYKQMCTLGRAPYDMLEKSFFRENHFYGTSFMRQLGLKKTIKFVYNFKKSKRIHNTLFDVYTRDWSEVRTEQRAEDLVKLVDFKILLEQMLVIHPKHRLSIEFVYANPFIYEFTDVP